MAANKQLKELALSYGEARSRYNSLVTYREALEKTWEDCSKLTLPYLFPSSSHTESTTFDTPYNSIGPASVNNLASKLLLALLPASGNFFRLIPLEEAVAELSTDEQVQLDKELSKLEKGINTMIDTQALRVPMYEALKYLIVTGNVMLYKVKNGGIKIFNPYEYVVSRDYVGNVVEIGIKEKVAKNTLPQDILDQIDESPDRDKSTEVEELEVYTSIIMYSSDKWFVYQEIDDVLIEKSLKEYSTPDLPYLPLRWTNTFSESYGRGLVEQYLGDLRSLEGLTKIILDGAGAAARVIFGIRPAATTKLEDLQAARNGDAIVGDLDRDITVLKVDKGMDLQVPFNLMGQLEMRLNRAFLNVQGGVRDSERTTAVEVRATIAELEAALGGTYSVLAQELQLPLLRLLLKEANPQVLKITEPSIVTGASAISRERDLQNLTMMVQSMAQLGPDVVGQFLKVDGYLRQVATALGIDPDLVVKSQEQLQQEQQMAMQQQQAMMQQEQSGAVQLEREKQKGKQ